MSKDYPLTRYCITQYDVNKELSCTICLCNYQKNEANVVKLNCGHVFHKNCIIPWFSKNPNSLTCPICRRNIYDPVVNSKEHIAPTRRANNTLGMRGSCTRNPNNDYGTPTNRVPITDDTTSTRRANFTYGMRGNCDRNPNNDDRTPTRRTSILDGITLKCDRNPNNDDRTPTRRTNITDGVPLNCDRNPNNDDRTPTRRISILDGISLKCDRYSNNDDRTPTRRTNITDGVPLNCDRYSNNDVPASTNRVLITDDLTPRNSSREINSNESQCCILI